MEVLKRILLVACLCFGVFTTQDLSAIPQETTDGRLFLSLNEATEFALMHNRRLQVSDLSVQRAERARWQSIAVMLPSVTASLSYSNFLGHEIVFGEPPMAMVMSMPNTGDLTVQAAIAFNGMMPVGVQLSRLAAEMSQTNRNLTELEVRNNVRTAYFSVLLAKKSKELIGNTRSNLQELYESTSRLYEVGMTEQITVDQLAVQLRSLDNTIRMTERHIELAYNSLRLILGSDDMEIELTQTLEQFLEENNVFETAMTPFDMNDNYNVQLLRQNVDLSRKQLRLSQWEFSPTLSVFYQYYTRTTFNQDEGLNMNPPHVVGATLSIPLFTGGGRLSRVQQARIDVRTAELTKEDAVESLRVRENQLRFNLRTAIEIFETERENVRINERIFQNATQRFELGVISSTELTTINSNLISAQISYINAIMEMLTAQTELKTLLNNL